MTTTWKSTLDTDRRARGMVAGGRLATPRPTRPRWSSATTSGSSAAPTPTARSAPCSAANSASAGAGASPTNPDEGKVVAWAVERPRTCRSPGRMPPAGRPTARSTWPAAPTDRRQSEVYWAIPTTTATSRSGSTSTSSDLPAGSRGRRPSSAARTPSWSAARPTTACRLERPGQHRPAAAVLPARPRRRDRPGPHDRRRDRPAAGLPQRGRRRHRQLHPADPHRLGVRPQGADPRAVARGLRGAARPAAQPVGEVALAGVERRRARPAGRPAPRRPSRRRR